MIILSLKKAIFRYRIIWFSKLPNQFSTLSFSEYRQCESVSPTFGFFRYPFYTLHIDLSKNNSDIFDEFDKSTKYKIKRAMREEVVCSINENYDYFTELGHENIENKYETYIDKFYNLPFRNENTLNAPSHPVT